MRTVGPRVVATATTLLALLGASAGMARGDRVVETVYVDPVSYYVPTAYSYVPTSSSYVYPTSYVATSATYLPTSYVATGYSYVPASSTYLATGYSYVPTSTTYVPTSTTYVPTSTTYVPTSYAVTPAYYEAVTYRRPGLLRRLASRPVYETTRTYAYDPYPTTYYLPTTIAYDAPAVATTALAYTGCVEATVPFNPPPPAAGAANAPAADPNATSKSIRSQPRQNEPVYQQNPANTQTPKATATPKAATPPADAPAFPSDPVTPDKDLSPPDSPPRVGGSGPGAGAGTGGTGAGTGPADAGTSTTNFRPRVTEMRARTDVATQPMLRGEVVSGVNGTPRSGLKVIFTDLRGTYQDRSRTTDANGNFEVFLPNGSWSVQVLDPAAATPKASVFGQITSTAGRYLDDNDSPIYALKLNY